MSPVAFIGLAAVACIPILILLVTFAIWLLTMSVKVLVPVANTVDWVISGIEVKQNRLEKPKTSSAKPRKQSSAEPRNYYY